MVTLYRSNIQINYRVNNGSQVKCLLNHAIICLGVAGTINVTLECVYDVSFQCVRLWVNIKAQLPTTQK